VIRIRRALEILQVAGHARRTRQVVVVVDVAIGALPRRHGVQSGQLKPGSAVIEDCVQPGAGAVALLTSLREIRRDVIRIRRALKVLQVAGHAGRTRQVVVVIDVAIGALTRRHGMQSRQCKSGSRVIELAIGPSHSVVTLQTSRGETRVRHGADRGVVILLVAADAGCGSDVVVVVDVAIRTLPRGHHVRTRQRKTGLGVIKSCRLPGCRVVTSLAGL
jgi:hydrogenase maturation factor